MKIRFAFLLLAIGLNAQLYQVPVYSAQSLQPAQAGEEASKAIDDDDNTIYHSNWNQNGIPDEMTFYFINQIPSIKKMIYTPRQSGSNGIWTDVSVYYSTQSAPENFILYQDHLIWPANNQNKEVEFNTPIIAPFAVKVVIHEGVNNFSSCAEMRFYSENQVFTDDGVDCIIPTSELILNGANDIKAVISANGSTASSYQGGEDITKSFDGNLNTLYHSSWSNTVFPVVLNYRLDGNTAIDYLKYIPRSDGGSNGNFGQISIRYNTTANSNFQDLMDFDFGQAGTPTHVYFPQQITPLNIEITVYDGYAGFASCAEMEFYTEGGSAGNPDIPTVFADELCSELIPGTTQAQINAIPSPFYRSLAQCIFNETYDKTYRIQTYEPYQTVQSLSQSLKIGEYDRFENMTGILFEANQKIALFAHNIPFETGVYLAVKDFESSFDGPVSYYELKNGLNVFEISHAGLGYISYFSNQENLNPIQIHIVSGKINGYFDLHTSNDADWASLLTKTTYPLVDLRGDFVHLVYERNALKNGSPFQATPLLNKYDEIVKHERLLMGLFKYNRSPKNRQLTYSDRGGGWWAGGLGVHLDLDWGEHGVVNPNALDVWGIPHEYGHINQIRPDLLWIGTTEVTNNIYSVWVDYHMNNEQVNYSRLEREKTVPASGMISIEGGRINGAILDYTINQMALQAKPDYDVFEVLVPFWQLQLYYQLAGASKGAPILSFDYPQDYTGIDYAHWYGYVAEQVRNANHGSLSHGEYLLNFVKYTCEAVQEDLTDFFLHTGFLRPINRQIDDYGLGWIQITQNQIDEVIDYIASQNYPQPVSPVIHYLSAHSVEAFKDLKAVEGTTGQGVSLNGQYLSVQHSIWKNVVAFETFNTEGELIYVSIVGTGDLSLQTSKVYYPTNALKVYAVGFDGQKILVYPNEMNTTESNLNSQFNLVPNPIQAHQKLKLELPDSQKNYQIQISNLEGQFIGKSNGNSTELEEFINLKIIDLPKGIYIITLIDENHRPFTQRLIKK